MQYFVSDSTYLTRAIIVICNFYTKSVEAEGVVRDARDYWNE